MVFSCLKCNARYRIGEERLEGKVLKFTCRKCGQVHLLRDPAKGGETVSAFEKSTSRASASGRVRRTTTSSQAIVTGAKPTTSMPTVGSGSSSGRVPTTRTDALPAVPSEKSAQKAKAHLHKDVWFAIRKGNRVGPMQPPRIAQMLRDGALHERSFMWRPTMSSWVRMNQVPELHETVRDFEEWKAGQYDRTVVRPSASATPTPSAIPSKASPPPLPEESSGSISFADAPKTVAGGDEVVDSLYSGISQPAIDIRKAHEVQDDEPEIPDADQPPPLPPAPPGPAVAPAKAHVDREEPGDEDLFPTDDASGSAEFFNKAQVLPAGQWPPRQEASGPSSHSGARAITFGEAAASRVAPPAAGEPGKDTRLEDFSVMVRLTRRGRKHKFAVLGTLGVVLAGGIGLVLYLALTSGPADLGLGNHETGDVPVFKQKLYAVIKPEPEPVQTVAAPKTGRRVFSGTPRKPAPIGPSPSSAAATPPPEPEPVKLGEIDPKARVAFDRYSGILKNGSEKRGETEIDVKPVTMTEMPKRNFDKSGMDAFLATKMRKFSDCKRRMTRKTDMPVKVGLSFSIGLDGRVGGIMVDQAGGQMDEGLDGCIRRVVGGWAFPPPDEAVTYKSTLLL